MPVNLVLTIGVAIVVAAAVVTWFVVRDHEVKLPAAEQATIEKANCNQLVDLHYGYSENADSVDTARTGLGRVDRRRSALACHPIAISEGAWHNIRYERDCQDLNDLTAQYAGRADELAVQALGQIALARARRC